MTPLTLFSELVPTFEPPTPGQLVVSWGAGVDSTAILVEFVRLFRAGDPTYLPAHIVFADTGGEKPETYAYIPYFSQWLTEQGFPPVTIVRSSGKDATLEEKCLRLETLPALAFGWKTCSDNFKRGPITKHLRAEQKAIGGRLSDLVCVIGFDANERRRISVGQAAGDQYARAFPLPAWGWDRADCVHEIKREGLEVPVKSACFFCPASKRHEIVDLAVNHPPLALRAARMEAGATKARIAGLGRSFAWTPLMMAANAGLIAHQTEVE